MIPRIAKSGTSFKGAWLYYAHDKKKQTSERVEFSATRNLGSNDIQTAAQLMAYTAANQNEIKQEAGGDNRGRKLINCVLSYSLSWSPNEKPTKEQMLEAGDNSIDAIGANEYQAFMVAHNDEPHPHIHIIINRVHPDKGIALKESYNKLKLSKWAQEFEQSQGKILCKQRVENNAKREEIKLKRNIDPKSVKGELVRGRNLIIQEAWNNSNNGKSFSNALKERGYILAKGDKRGFVVIDPEGKTINPTRHIEGENGKNIRAKILSARVADLNLETLQTVEDAKKSQLERQYWDRDKYNREQEEKLIDAAIKTNKGQVQADKEQNGGETKAPPKKKEYTPFAENLDKVRALEAGQQRRLNDLKEQQKENYNREKLEQQLSQARQEVSKYDNFLGKLRGKHGAAIEQVANYQSNLENILQREAEQKQTLENALRVERQGFEQSQPQEARQELNQTKEIPQHESVKDMLAQFDNSAAPSNDNVEKSGHEQANTQTPKPPNPQTPKPQRNK